MKKVLWIVMAIAMVLALGGCTEKEEQTQQPVSPTLGQQEEQDTAYKKNVYILEDGSALRVGDNGVFMVWDSDKDAAVTGELSQIATQVNQKDIEKILQVIGKDQVEYIEGQEEIDLREIILKEDEPINPVDEDKPFKDANRLAVGVKSAFAVTDDLRVIGSDHKYNTSGWTDILSIDYMYDILVGLKTDGTVITKGRKVDTENWTDIVQVCAGIKYIVGLKEDGTVLAAGHNGDGQCNVEDWTDVRLIATGWRHTIGLTNDGKILLAGRVSSKSREMAEMYQGTNIKDIVGGGGGDIGQGHTVILYNDGTCKAFGDNTYNQCDVDDWTDIVQISAGDWHTLGLKSDGTVVVTNPTHPGDLYTGCLRVTDWTDIIRVEAGTGLSVGVKSDGSLVCVGFNSEGQREAINNMHS